MRILAIDYGLARIGLAISDEMGYFARPLQVIRHIAREADADNVARIAQQAQAQRLLVGMPLSGDGTLTLQARVCRNFGEALQLATSLPVIYWDESYSSQAAQSLTRSKRKKPLDAVAAAIFLQDYLDQHFGSTHPPQPPNPPLYA